MFPTVRSDALLFARPSVESAEGCGGSKAGVANRIQTCTHASEKAIINQARIVRLPAHVYDDLRHLRRVSRELESGLGRRPTPRELSEQMGMPARKIRRLMQWEKRTVLSLDMVVGDDENSEFGDSVPDQNTPPVEEVLTDRQLRECIRDRIKRSSYRIYDEYRNATRKENKSQRPKRRRR